MSRNINNKDVGEVCASIARLVRDCESCKEELIFEVQEYMLSVGIVDDYNMGDETSIEGTPQNTAWEDNVADLADKLIQKALRKIESL